MKTTRTAAAAAALLFISALLLPGQTVVEAAKKEKERREALKGKAGVVVTNADLGRTKKKPAMSQPADEGMPPGEKPAQAPSIRNPPVDAQPLPQDIRVEQARIFDEGKIEIENRLKAAQEMISLLKLKMAALQQQFYNFSNTTPREKIQRDISETYQKLQAAGGEEAKIKDELDKFVAAGPSVLQVIR